MKVLARNQTNRAVPGPEQELALLLCQTAEARARHTDRIARLARQADADELVATFVRNGLLVTCGSRLEAICGELLPASFLAAKEESAARLRARALLLETVTARLLLDLEAAGIRTLPVKGVMLARRIYGGAPVRPALDIDILVSRNDLAAARKIVESHGYGPPGDVPMVDGLPKLHYKFESLHGALPPVELHWRIHWYETAFSEGMLERSELDDAGIRRATPADELAALLLFYQRDSFLGLKLAADIAAWWDEYGWELPCSALAPIADEHPELRDALLVSAAVVERLVGAPATGLVGGPPLRPRRAAWAARLGDWSYGEITPQMIANLSLIDWLLTPRGAQGAYARRYLFQPPLTFAREHGLPEEPRLRDHARRSAHGVVRIGKAQARLGLALWQLRGGRFWRPLPASLECRPLLLWSGNGRKKVAHPAVVEACDAITSTRSGSPSNPTSNFPESPPPATTDAGQA
jgi:hypothetical protein